VNRLKGWFLLVLLVVDAYEQSGTTEDTQFDPGSSAMKSKRSRLTAIFLTVTLLIIGGSLTTAFFAWF
jgi:hypothetical protein